jgi:hypothetical protein
VVVLVMILNFMASLRAVGSSRCTDFSARVILSSPVVFNLALLSKEKACGDGEAGWADAQRLKIWRHTKTCRGTIFPDDE